MTYLKIIAAWVAVTIVALLLAYGTHAIVNEINAEPQVAKPPAFDATIQPAQGKWDLGSKVYRWGEGADHIYIAAPQTAVVILLSDGRRVVIGREEIERRATK